MHKLIATHETISDELKYLALEYKEACEVCDILKNRLLALEFESDSDRFKQLLLDYRTALNIRDKIKFFYFENIKKISNSRLKHNEKIN